MDVLITEGYIHGNDTAVYMHSVISVSLQSLCKLPLKRVEYTDQDRCTKLDQMQI